jgi:putative colanic acid biosynthesis acetyltransferase WcaF
MGTPRRGDAPFCLETLMDLSRFQNDGFDRGRSRLIEVLWNLGQWFLFSSPLPGSVWRIWILRAFGAQVGAGVIIKPRVRVKFPWKLTIGDHVWIGEDVWIDNLASVRVGSNSCISQGAYLCTGSHDWTSRAFDLIARPIEVGERVWLGAMVRLAPGTVAADGCVVTLGSVASGGLKENTIYSGVPAIPTKDRTWR